MQLSNAIREDIAEKLVAEATKKHAPAMAKAAKSLDKLWRDAITRAWSSWQPAVPQALWVPMIQGDAMRHLTSIAAVKPTLRNKGTQYEKWADDTDPVGRRRLSYGSYRDARERDALKLKGQSVSRAICGNWDGFFNYVSASAKDNDLEVAWRTRYADLPGAAFLTVINQNHLAEGFIITDDNRHAVAWSRAAWPLVEKAEDLIDKFNKVFQEALEFHTMVSDLLQSCKTAKQLEERFPEAAKFLPAPVVKRNEIIPTEVFDKARKMLVEGIPN